MPHSVSSTGWESGGVSPNRASQASGVDSRRLGDTGTAAVAAALAPHPIAETGKRGTDHR